MKHRVVSCFSVVVFAMVVPNAGATLLFYDGFNYPASQLLAPQNGSAGRYNSVANTNWYYAGANTANTAPPAIAGAGLNYNDVTGYSGLQSTVGNSVLFDTTQLGSARIQVTPAAIGVGNTVFYSGLLQVGNVANLNAVNGMILGGLVPVVGAGTLPGTVGGVLRIRQSSTSGAYNIGVGMNSGTAAGNVQFDSIAHPAGETLFVVVAYDLVSGANNDVARMWINPNPADFGAGSPPTATLTAAPGGSVADSSTTVLGFNLRNANTVGTPTGVLFDELLVGTTWADVTTVPEPAAAGLLGLGVLMIVGRYRFRKR